MMGGGVCIRLKRIFGSLLRPSGPCGFEGFRLQGFRALPLGHPFWKPLVGPHQLWVFLGVGNNLNWPKTFILYWLVVSLSRVSVLQGVLIRVSRGYYEGIRATGKETTGFYNPYVQLV